MRFPRARHGFIRLSVGLSLMAVVPAKPTQATVRPGPSPAVTLTRSVLDRIDGARAKRDVEALSAFGTRHTLSDTQSPERGIGAARNWLKAQFEALAAAGGAPLSTRFEEFTLPSSARLPQGGTIVNVVAVLPGSMPEAADRHYYVVGHYDSRNADPLDASGDAPGANDNASGTAVVLELARALAAHGQLESTVVFLCTAGEEQGLLGAAAHADAARAAGVNIAGVLNNDIVGDPSGPDIGGVPGSGRSMTRVVRVFSEALPRNPTADQLAAIRANSSEHDSPSRQLARFVAAVAEQHGLPVRPMLVARPDRFLRGGDHLAFNDAGFAAVRFTEVDEDYSRQHVNLIERDGRLYGDVPEFVDAEYLGNVARLNAAAIVHMASAPRPPTKARLLTAALSNGATITWDASPEPDVAGYEVVYRSTTAPTWERAFDAGATTRFEVVQSKDDHIFGVRAYDRDGFRSPVAFAFAAKE